MRLVCSKCSFQFESNEMKNVCTYCGEKNGIQIVKEAEDLVEEIDFD